MVHPRHHLEVNVLIAGLIAERLYNNYLRRRQKAARGMNSHAHTFADVLDNRGFRYI